MIHLLLLLIFPLVIPAVAFFVFNKKITWKEMLLSAGLSVIVPAAVFGLGRLGKTIDVQIFNGEVTGKERVRVSCSHSYQVLTGFDSKGNPQYTTHYEHSHDVDWRVYTNVDETIEIDRVDRQGTDQPPRWTAVKKGEPVAVSKYYENYVKAANESLFAKNAKAALPVPRYPKNIYDYYRLDRFVVDGIGLPADVVKRVNVSISENLKIYGPQKQANYILFLTNKPDVKYAEDIKNRWHGGKKNDIILVIGAPEFPKIAWVNVISWSKNAMFDVALRDAIYEQGTFNADNVLLASWQNINQHYVRRSMKEFDYLKWEIEPDTGVLVIAWIFSIGGPIGMCIWSYKDNLI